MTRNTRLKDFLGFIAEDIQVFRDILYIAELRVCVYRIDNVWQAKECTGFDGDIVEQLYAAVEKAENDLIDRLIEKHDYPLSEEDRDELYQIIFEFGGQGKLLTPDEAIEQLLGKGNENPLSS